MRNVILKKGNVFIYASYLKDEVKNDTSYIIDEKSGLSSKWLYGGRVRIQYYGGWRLTIDGITIFGIGIPDGQGQGVLGELLSVSTLVAYLNQMEALGIDSFLKNYKETMQEFKNEMSENAEKLEADLTITKDDMRISRLRGIQDILHKLSFIILALSINMFAGHDNHVYEEAYQSIINVYSV